MDTSNIALVLCGICAAGLLVLAFIWYYIFGRSTRRVIMAGIAALTDRDAMVDPNKPVDIAIRPDEVKDVLDDIAEGVDFEASVAEHQKNMPAMVDALALDDEDTTFSNRPSAVSRVVHAMSRPFRFRRYRAKDDSTSSDVK